MSNAFYFNLILFFLVAIIALEVLAKKLRWPPAVAQLIGGALIAFIPGLPAFEIDPALVLVVFLPPLLMAGAYFTVWHEFSATWWGFAAGDRRGAIYHPGGWAGTA